MESDRLEVTQLSQSVHVSIFVYDKVPQPNRDEIYCQRVVSLLAETELLQ